MTDRSFSGILALLLLFTAAPAAGQVIAPQGDPSTLDVATWNVEWFGANNGPSDDTRQRANVRAVIEQSGVDLWALQEIADPDDFALLLQELGEDFDGFYRENASGSVSQRLAFVYRKEAITVRRVEQWLTPQYDVAFAYRPPLVLDASVTLPDTTVHVVFVTIHMKASGDVDSYNRRKEAAQGLKNRIDFLYPSTPIIVLGDFNDELRFSITTGFATPYEAFVQDDENYQFLTMPLDETNRPTYCGSSTSCSFGSTLDHILITNELFAAYEAGSADRYEALLDAFDGTGGACGGEFVCTTSDHLPVVAHFAFRRGTAVERGDLPQGVALEPVYPQPFRDRATVAFTLDRAAHLRLEVIDVLGRRVAQVVDGLLPAGRHEAVLDGASLAPGLYLVRLDAGGRRITRTVVRVR